MRHISLISLTGLFLLGLSLGVAWPQHVIIRVSPDGSLVIQESSGSSLKNPSEGKNSLDLVSSQLNVRIIRGSTENPGVYPLITRGRAHRRNVASPWSPSPEPLAQQLPGLETPLVPLIEKSAQEHGIDPGLVRLVIQKESGYNSQAVSPKGAMGLMQLMPGTASLLGVQDPFNPAQNIDGGVRYLKQCLERFNHNVCLALAAYNAGPENVAKYQGVPPFAETRKYVANILQEYTGEPVDLPGPPGIMPGGQNPRPARNVPKKTAFSQTDLQPLFLPGGESVNVIRSGKTKIFEIIAR
jgi:hypothetical protein